MVDLQVEILILGVEQFMSLSKIEPWVNWKWAI